MIDERLRRRERARRAGGGLAGEVAWLQERVRAGLLARDRLELAARLGHGPSRAVLGGGRFRPVRPGELFERWGREAMVRVALTLAERARTRFPQDDPEEARLDAILSATQRWCVAPTPDDVPPEPRTSGARATRGGSAPCRWRRSPATSRVLSHLR